MNKKEFIELNELIFEHQYMSSITTSRAIHWLMVALYWPDRKEAKQAAVYAKMNQDNARPLSEVAITGLLSLLHEERINEQSSGI